MVSTTPAANFAKVSIGLMIPVTITPMANNGNNSRLLRPYSELEGKNVSII
jgi:hypothetical protein